MIMRDNSFKELKEMQKVYFGAGLNHWYGEVLEVNHQEEQVLIKVTKRETGVGMIERMNRIECSRYIYILQHLSKVLIKPLIIK